MDTGSLVREIEVNATAAKVWKAITDKSEMKQWYFDIKDFKPEEGYEFHFYGGDESKQYLHLCKITEVVPEKKISYTWRYEEDPAITHVTFELFPEGEKTRVRLTHSCHENFSPDKPEFARENFEKGWDYLIGTSLKNHLEN